jgi:hypothetical protein
MGYVIDQQACSECVGFFSTPQCAQVCPMNCCVFNPDMVLSEAALFARAAHTNADTPPALTDNTSHFRQAAHGKWWQQLFRSLGVHG